VKRILDDEDDDEHEGRLLNFSVQAKESRGRDAPDDISEILARTRWPSPTLCANGCEFATDSRFLRCCDLLGERVLQVSSPRGRAISDGVGTNQAKGTSMGLELVFENERCSKQEQNSKETTLALK